MVYIQGVGGFSLLGEGITQMCAELDAGPFGCRSGRDAVEVVKLSCRGSRYPEP